MIPSLKRAISLDASKRNSGDVQSGDLQQSLTHNESQFVDEYTHRSTKKFDVGDRNRGADTAVDESESVLKSFESFDLDSISQDTGTAGKSSKMFGNAIGGLAGKAAGGAIGGAMGGLGAFASELTEEASELTGKSLRLFEPDNEFRVRVAEVVKHPFFDMFLLVLILVNLVSLAMTSPGGGELSAAAEHFNRYMNGFNIFAAIVFTIEAGMRIVMLGFVKGPGTYLQNSWNIFDFFLIVVIWLSMTASSIFQLDGDVGLAFNVLRTIRIMRFFKGIREIMSAVTRGYRMLTTIVGLLLYAYTLVSVIGMELFGGTISRKCHLPTEAEPLGLVLSDCPPMLQCEDNMQCYEAVKGHWTQDRDRYVHRFGFDNLWTSFNTAFGVTILDGWSGMSIALSEAESSTRILAFPLFMLMVLIISLLIVNLFLASVTVSFLGVRQEMRAELVGQTKQPTALEALELANAIVPAEKQPAWLTGVPMTSWTEEQVLAWAELIDIDDETRAALLTAFDDEETGGEELVAITAKQLQKMLKRADLPGDLATGAEAVLAFRDSNQKVYSFPMNAMITPATQKLVAAPKFESAIAFSVLMNTVLMMMNHHNMEPWLEVTTLVFELTFTSVYTFEMCPGPPGAVKRP